MYSPRSSFEASILVNGRPVTEVKHEGNTYIEGRKGTEYALFFRNNSPKRVLVVPSVDGMSVIDGELASLQSGGYVVGPRDSITIPGWTVSHGEAAAFVFHAQDSAYRDERTYAEETGKSQNNQGVIGFLVFEEKEPQRTVFPTHYKGMTPRGGYSGNMGNASPQIYNSTLGGAGQWSHTDELIGSSVTTTSTTSVPDLDTGKPLGTGFGDAVDFGTTEVQFIRKNPDNPRASFVLYYDTKSNLRRLGVPVEQFSRHYSESRSSGPSPFPGSPEKKFAKPPKGWNKRNSRGRR